MKTEQELKELKQTLTKYNNLKKFFTREEWRQLESWLLKIKDKPPARILTDHIRKQWGYEDFTRYNPTSASDFLNYLFPWEMISKTELSILKAILHYREVQHKSKQNEQNKKITS